MTQGFPFVCSCISRFWQSPQFNEVNQFLFQVEFFSFLSWQVQTLLTTAINDMIQYT